MSFAKTELVMDGAGQTMELIKCKNGRYIAADMNLDTIENLHSLTLRNDDIMLCSYPKSGCHWLWETLRYMIHGDSDVHLKVDKESYMIELNTTADIDALESPRILNNHLYLNDQPTDLLDKKVKVVFVYRNIKDVAVSFYYHHNRDRTYKYEGTFNQYLQRFLAGLVDSGSVFEYMNSWETGIKQNRNLDIHILSYEDMTENPLKELRRLNEFLDTSRDDDFLQMVIRETSMQAMRHKKGPVTSMVDDKGSPIMYRKGKVGDWRNHFSEDQSKMVDDIIKKDLGHSTLFTFKYETEAKSQDNQHA